MDQRASPYSQAHVSYVAKAYRDKSTYQPRPRFRDVYNAVANPAAESPIDCEALLVTAVLPAVDALVRMSAALRDVRDRRLYRETHDSFDGYCQERWGFSGEWANAVIERSPSEMFRWLSTKEQLS